MLGYPIRTPSDHSSVDNSPRTIAASHVLHRLLMPRHPPCALQHFTHNKHAQTTKPDTKKDARIHYATLNTPPHPETHHNHHHTHPPQQGAPTGCVRRSRPGAATRKNNPPTGRCLLRTQQRAELVQLLALCSTQPHPPQRTRGVEITRRKPTTTRRRPAPPYREAP